MVVADATIAAMTYQKWLGSWKNGSGKFMPITPARTTAGRKTADSRVRTFMTSVRVLGLAAHHHVECPEEELAQVLDRIERPVEMLGQGGPRLAEVLVELHLRPGERRERDPVHGQRPTDHPDPAPQRDDAAQDLGLAAPAEGALVELVDLALDALGEFEVVRQRLVDDGGQERPGIEGAEAGLALGQGIDPIERAHRPVVDGEDPIPTGHEIDGAPDRGLRVHRGRIGRLHRDEGEVDVFGIGGQIGPARRAGEVLDHRGLQPEGFADRGEVLVVSTVEIDPPELAVAEVGDQVLVELDLAILAIGVIEPDARPARGPIDGIQRIAARRTAKTMARAAVPYWRTSMAWSGCALAGGGTRAVRTRKVGW